MVENGITDLRVTYTDLKNPYQIKQEVPITEIAVETVKKGRKGIEGILDRKDSRIAMLLGPCSIHDPQAARDYAENLKVLAEKVEDRILVGMRTYFEKPRTSLGWKGLIYDPNLNGSEDMDEGYLISRQVLKDINELGLPTATEYLESFTPQFNSDLVSWAAIGARTAYSPQHRQMASGLSMPVGIKNDTHGDISVAVNGVLLAREAQSFPGITEHGKAVLLKTTGNKYAHIVLRGGDQGPNYDAESVKAAQEMLEKAELPPVVVIDASHDNTFEGNGRKNYEKQIDVFQDTIKQVKDGNRGIVGLMLESNLKAGNQKIPSNLRGFDRSTLEYGLSVTDPCLDLETTIDLIMDAYRTLSKTSAQVAK